MIAHDPVVFFWMTEEAYYVWIALVIACILLMLLFRYENLIAAWRFKRLRRKVSSKRYYEDRLLKYAEKCKDWNHFQQFDCSTFFRGSEYADWAQRHYNKYGARASRKYEWYARKVDQSDT